jgi:hypothetical protein
MTNADQLYGKLGVRLELLCRVTQEILSDTVYWTFIAC